MLVLDLKKLARRYWSPRLVWDLFMVLVATINLGLIVFDFTYLAFRPFYLKYVPVVARIYDPVLGISPHPLIEELLDEATDLRGLIEKDPGSAAAETSLARIRILTYRVIQENPFDRSEQIYKREVFKDVISNEIGLDFLNSKSRDPWGDAVIEFWSEDVSLLEARLELFDIDLSPLLVTNYHRAVDSNGNLKDLFWLVDLPFLLFFILEFSVRWAYAVRHRLYTRWFFFPILNWYDLIGCIPYTQFRIFRLFRVVSIYMRLYRSELTRVGRDTVTRGVSYISNIIVEEISDAVAVRILNEVQEEIREGTAKTIINDTVDAKREEISGMLLAQVKEILGAEPTQKRLREMVRLNLDKAVETSSALRSVPLPNVVVRRLVHATGEVVIQTILTSLTATLESEEGDRAARELIGDLLDQILTGPWRAELDKLSSEISLDVIEQVKKAVSVKKWAQPNQKS
jgi:hypothetical protein